MKKCKSCKEPIKYTERNGLKTYAHKYGYCFANGCLSDYYLNNPEGKEKLNKATIKAAKHRKDLETAKEEHKNNKSLSWLLQNTVNACHDYIKERDKGKPCISCNEAWHSDFHAGHFYKAELFSTLKLDETNIHGQCIGCNNFKDGNESGYRVGLIKRYSKGFLDLLDSKALLDKKTSFKWDREQLKKTRQYYKQKLKKLLDYEN